MQNSSQTHHLIKNSQDLQNSLISRDTLTPLEIPKQDQVVENQKPATTGSRLNSLDFHRGLTIFGMVMTSPSSNAPEFMKHAKWDGLTPVDLIFPSFMFIMGIAVPLAVTVKKPVKPRNILRIIALFVIGLFFQLWSADWDFTELQFMGAFQRLSLCYGSMILVHWATNYGQNQKRIYGFLAIISAFLIYISYMLSYQSPEAACQGKSNLSRGCTFYADLDKKIFGRSHVWYPDDAEGLFNTLPGLFTTYIGYYFCLIMKDNKNDIKKTLKYWTLISVILGLTVYPLTKMMPINKRVYSASFAVLTAAVAGATLILIVLLVDMLPEKNKMAKKVINFCIMPFIWMGRNSLFFYVLNEVGQNILKGQIHVGEESLDKVIEKWIDSWMGNPEVSCELKALCYLLVYLIPTFILYKKEIFIRL